MTSRQIDLVKKTWDQVSLNPDGVARYFYERLFAVEPGIRRLFPTSMEEQGRKLIRMLASVVAALDRVDEGLPTVAALAVRHVEYGAEEEHYPVVRGVLLETLSASLADDFTTEVEEAWARVYDSIAERMIALAA